MSQTYLLLDVNYLAYRAFHTHAKLSFGLTGTGVTFGVLNDVLKLQDQFATRNVVWAFDHGIGLRKQVYPAYKAKRHSKVKMTEEQLLAWKQVRKQVELLKKEYLPYLGYENVFYQAGYEADDVIASVCNWLPDKDHAVIVSGDKDLYQLLRHNVMVWNPNTAAKVRAMTQKAFTKEYGVHPDHWRWVKAVAGCSTDEIEGCKGVGEITAARYMNACMKPKGENVHKKELAIREFVKTPQFLLNRDLVRLPYTGTDRFVPVQDEVDRNRWRKLIKKLGMKSLRDRCPMPMAGFGFKKVLMKGKS